MTLTVVFSALVVTATVVGVVLIHRLGKFFKSNYDKQRFSLMTALVLIVLSFLLLAARYGLEYSYLEKNLVLITVSDDHYSFQATVPLFLLITFLIVSDFGPIIAQMYCMWLAKTGQWDDLISGYLEAPYQEEDTTVGPDMLEGLKSEFERERFKSELLSSRCMSESDKPSEFLGTAYIVRDGFADELRECEEADSIIRGGSIVTLS